MWWLEVINTTNYTSPNTIYYYDTTDTPTTTLNIYTTQKNGDFKAVSSWTVLVSFGFISIQPSSIYPDINPLNQLITILSTLFLWIFSFINPIPPHSSMLLGLGREVFLVKIAYRLNSQTIAFLDDTGQECIWALWWPFKSHCNEFLMLQFLATLALVCYLHHHHHQHMKK